MRLWPLLALMLAGCGDSNQPAPPPPLPQPAPSVWFFAFSPGMQNPPSHGVGGFRFSFPGADGAHYLVRPYGAALSSKLAMSYIIETTGAPVFQAVNDPGCVGRGYARLYFQQQGDNLQNEFGRWWAEGFKQELAAGSFSVVAPVAEAARWTSVYGKNGADFAAQFATARANAGMVGVTFGCDFAGHGVFVTGGTATMAATIFDAN